MKTTAAKTETSHTLVFMGVGPVETFRCRIYAPEPCEPLTKEEARAWLLADAAKYGAEGTYAPRDEAWNDLVEEMCEEGVVHMYGGRVFLGPDYKHPGEK